MLVGCRVDAIAFGSRDHRDKILPARRLDRLVVFRVIAALLEQFSSGLLHGLPAVFGLSLFA